MLVGNNLMLVCNNLMLESNNLMLVDNNWTFDTHIDKLLQNRVVCLTLYMSHGYFYKSIESSSFLFKTYVKSILEHYGFHLLLPSNSILLNMREFKGFLRKA